jgi:hypothetical protein
LKIFFARLQNARINIIIGRFYVKTNAPGASGRASDFGGAGVGFDRQMVAPRARAANDRGEHGETLNEKTEFDGSH